MKRRSWHALVAVPLSIFFVERAAVASRVYIVKAADRSSGLSAIFAAMPLPDLRGKTVAIKPNFNSADPYPATTNLETLEFVIEKAGAAGARSITIAERSGMGDTMQVIGKLGIFDLARKHGASVVVLDEIGSNGWVKIDRKDTHWWRGFPVAKIFVDADYVINLPCLKTHRFGGHFTMSLKNNVGAVAKWHGGYNYMWELHISKSQREMIAEVNRYIPNHLIVMDAMKAIVTRGPDAGDVVEPGLILMSGDRVAIDAVGVAILRIYGTTEAVEAGRIFDQAQIKRAAEIGVGARSAAEIEVVAVNEGAKGIVGEIREKLAE